MDMYFEALAAGVGLPSKAEMPNEVSVDFEVHPALDERLRRLRRLDQEEERQNVVKPAKRSKPDALSHGTVLALAGIACVHIHRGRQAERKPGCSCSYWPAPRCSTSVHATCSSAHAMQAHVSRPTWPP